MGGLLSSESATSPATSAPTVSNVQASTIVNTSKAITLQGSDSEGRSLSFSVVTAPSSGTVVIAGSTATYTPQAGFTGNDTFTYSASNGNQDSLPATVTITVSQPNQQPVANNMTVNLLEDGAHSGALDATDPDGNTLGFVIVQNGSKGTATIIDASAGTFTYQPQANANGQDTFTFRAGDGILNSGVATVTVNITAVNDTPVANAVSAGVTQNIAASITLSGSDIDADNLSFQVASGPSHGSVSFTSANTVTYTPSANYVGADSFTYVANDGTVNSAAATVSITVSGAPSNSILAQNINAGSKLIGIDVPITLQGSGAASLTYQIVSQPAAGTVSAPSGSSVTYNSGSSASTGAQSFTYRACDNSGNCSSAATVSINLVSPASYSVGDTPVRIAVIKTSGGAIPYSNAGIPFDASEAQRAITVMNTYYNGKLKFVLDEYEELVDDNFYNMTACSLGMLRNKNKPNVVNAYVVNSMPGCVGVSYVNMIPSSNNATNFIALAVSGGYFHTSTFAHEMMHTAGAQHTIDSSATRTSTYAGKPGLGQNSGIDCGSPYSFSYTSWSWNDRPVNDGTFHPERDNVMAYGRSSAPTFFTTDVALSTDPANGPTYGTRFTSIMQCWNYALHHF